MLSTGVSLLSIRPVDPASMPWDDVAFRPLRRSGGGGVRPLRRSGGRGVLLHHPLVSSLFLSLFLSLDMTSDFLRKPTRRKP